MDSNPKVLTFPHSHRGHQEDDVTPRRPLTRTELERCLLHAECVIRRAADLAEGLGFNELAADCDQLWIETLRIERSMHEKSDGYLRRKPYPIPQ